MRFLYETTLPSDACGFPPGYSITVQLYQKDTKHDDGEFGFLATRKTNGKKVQLPHIVSESMIFETRKRYTEYLRNIRESLERHMKGGQ